MTKINIAEPGKITAYLTGQAGGNAVVARWLDVTLTSSLKKREESAGLMTLPPADAPAWLQNKWDTCGPFHEFKPDPKLDDQIRHIKDWLVSAQINNEPFLKDLDDKGRPKKLVQLDLEGAYNAADKYFAKLNQKFRVAVEDDNDTKTVMRFEDGSRIVQLLTTNALKTEGPAMGHCIGGGAYDKALTKGTHVFYSLRDAANKPHATFEVKVKSKTLLQCKGKENKPPAQKYMPMVQQFVTQKQFDLKERPVHTGLIRDDKGAYYSLFALPDGLSVGGFLSLRCCTGLTALPDGLSVGGDLDLTGCTGLTTLPDGLSVGGYLFLGGCTGLTTLSDGLSVGGYLDLGGCTGLTTLPDGLSVGEHLFLGGCIGLTSIPRTLKIEGDISTDLGDFKTVDAAADAFEAKFGKVVMKPAPRALTPKNP